MLKPYPKFNRKKIMLAEEFKTIVANGTIQIPDSIKTQFEGQEVRVIVLKASDKKSPLPFDLRKLFKDTQAFPQAQAISEDEISAKIDAYRQGGKCRGESS
ncbi:MAG: hypothetical protein VKL41_13950 [Snowella sp.]|nr:hypothetical protein [Snowella sp.]